MTENRLLFLKENFYNFDVLFSEDFSNAEIVNPNWNESITVYDEEFEFTVCFSFQHCHFEDAEDVVEWIFEVIDNKKLAIEFFNKEQRCFGSEIDVSALQDLTYERLEKFTGYYGLTKLLDVADSFKVRGWDSKNNFDFTFHCDQNGSITISKTFVGLC